MTKLYCLLALAMTLVTFAARAQAADRVRLIQGGQSSGKLSQISATQVTLELGATKKEFSVNEIDDVIFDDEPNDLSQARIAVKSGRYDDALTMLAKIDAGKLQRPEVIKDVQFYHALTAARMALDGNGSIAAAGKMMFAFEQANRDSFHYFEACRTLGDLLAALGQYPKAESYYNKLAEAPWPDYKMRAAVLVGRTLVSQKKFDEAIRQFDAVSNSDASGDGVDAQKAAATLGKASALSGKGSYDEAVKLAGDVIAKADPANEELYARAYNVLGNCYKAAGKNKEALLAFLHVDLLYAHFPELHAEALANLATLWAGVDKSDRAEQARNLLLEKYPNSVWAAK